MFCLTKLQNLNLLKTGVNLLVKPSFSNLIKKNVFYFASKISSIFSQNY